VELRLADTLSVLKPTETETALLRACLHSGPSARDGWARWREGRKSSGAALCAELANWRTLLPLLERSVARSAIDVGPDVRSYFRATALREELRAERYQKIAGAGLTALEDGGIAAMVVRGAALAATVYPAWPLRHCHDLDLLIPPGQLAAAEDALVRAGFRRTAHKAASRVDAIVEHAAGLGISLHTRPFAVAYHHSDADTFARGSRRITIDGVVVSTPSPEATLVHVLGHATYSSSRRNLRWVADAWHVLSGHPHLDWDDVVVRIAAHRLDLPVSGLLGYLAAFGLPVPADALAQVRERAGHADRLAEDVALGGITAATQGDVMGMWRSAQSWRGRLRLARWVVAPTPAYVREAFAVPTDWLIPLCYLYRPARFVAGRLARRPHSAEPSAQ
jgi:hypothetical protein